jgi:CubicO group peptidase (beta-lactamase class C family)
MSLPIAAPQEVGMDPRRLTVADSLVQGGVDEKVYSGAVLLAARRGKVVHLKAFGALSPGGQPTKPDSIFDMASVTKPSMAVGLLTLLEDGKIALTQEVKEWIPEAKGTPVGELSLRLLATHTSGLVAWKPLFKTEGVPEAKGNSKARQLVLEEILRTPLFNPPGTKYVYSDFGYILLGEIVSRASGMPLDQYLHSRVYAPLGMKDTGYRPAPTLRDRIASTSGARDRPGARIVGEVHDENSNSIGGVSGHAGLFSTAPDIAILADAVCRTGESGGHRVLGVPTLRLIHERQTDVGGHSVGWMTPPNTMLPKGDILGDTPFGHTGFTGTLVVCDPAYELVIVLLTNRVIYENTSDGMSRIRRRTVNAVASSIIS